MEKEIEFLKDHFGSYQAVAEHLGITYRHLNNARNGVKTGRFLKHLISLEVQSIKERETAGASAPQTEGARP